MPIVKRADKGSPLTHAELDGNFSALLEALPAPAYFVSTAGNNTNSGHSPAEPISLTHLLTLLPAFAGGEKIFFKRGETFDGTLSLLKGGRPGSRTLISAYGTGNKPVLRASQAINGLSWTSEGSGVWSAVAQHPVKMVWLNGVEQKRAGTDWLPVSSRPGTDSDNQFISTALQSAGFATGVIVGTDLITWEFPWRVGNMKVNAYNAATGLVTTTFQSAIKVGSYFKLEGRKEFISEIGEWFYETGTGKLYFKTLNGDSPVNYNLRASYAQDAITLASGAAYVEIENIQIQEAERYGISTSGGGHFRFENLTFRHVGQNAINCRHEYLDVKVLDNEFQHISNRAIVLGRPQGFVVSGNLIQDIGLGANLPDLRYDAEYDYYDYCGVGITALQEARNGIVNNNKIYRTAYNGIHLRGQNTEIRRNLIDTFSLKFNDGAGIYSFSQPYHVDEANQPLEDSFGVWIAKNIVRNGVGNNTYVPGTALFVNGIYVDNGSTKYVIEGNTTHDNPTCGIVVNFDTQDNTVRYNLSYNNKSAQLMYNTLVNSDPAVPYVVNLGNECYGNRLVCLHADQNCVEVHDFNGGASYNPFAASNVRSGRIDENLYLNPYSTNIFVYKAANAPTRGNLATLKTRFGGDALSRTSALQYAYVNEATARQHVRLLVNESLESQLISVGAGAITPDEQAVSVAMIPEFSADIVLKSIKTGYSELYRATYTAADGTSISSYVAERGTITVNVSDGTIQNNRLVAGAGAVNFGLVAAPNLRATINFAQLANGSTCYFDIRKSTGNSAFIDIIILRDVGGVIGVYIDELAPAYARRASATFSGVPTAFQVVVTANGSAITVELVGQTPLTATVTSSVGNENLTLYGDQGTIFDSFTVEEIESDETALPVVTGSTGSNAALTSLLSALSNLGLITNSTTT